jgi:hypothetical protein
VAVPQVAFAGKGQVWQTPLHFFPTGPANMCRPRTRRGRGRVPPGVHAHQDARAVAHSGRQRRIGGAGGGQGQYPRLPPRYMYVCIRPQIIFVEGRGFLITML